jgi:serine protease Do
MNRVHSFFVFTLGAPALAAASTLAPHPAVGPLDPAVRPQLIAQSGQGLPSFPEIVDAVKPSVIGVRTKVAPVSRKSKDQHRSGMSEDQLLPFGAPEGEPIMPDEHQVQMTQGSGFFISADGYAVTNGHVVAGSAAAEIKTDDGRTYSASVVGIDPVTDLALLKVDGARDDFTPVRLADQIPRVGEWVLAIGNPFGLEGTVTAGIVSAGKRNVGANSSEDLIQIDAPMNQGNSGGPTFDVDGQLIGVNTMIVSPTGGSIGIAFAIPADTLKTVIPQLKEKGYVARGWLGVQFQPAGPVDTLGPDSTREMIVADVQANGPAAAAGIARGDVITSINGERSADARDLVKRIRDMKPGTSIDLGVLRKAQGKAEEKVIAVTLGELPVERQARAAKPQEQERKVASPAASSLGLKLAPARTTSSAGAGGVVITGIDPNGSAVERGLSAGDVIIQMAGQAVNTPGEVRDALSKARREGKRFVLMQVKSGETTRFVAVPPDPA